MTRWVKNFSCENCNSTLGLRVLEKVFCFVCESEVKALRESRDEHEDYPSVMEAQGKGIGEGGEILSNIHSPVYIDQVTHHFQKITQYGREPTGTEGFQDFNIVALCPELPFVNVDTLLALSRNIRNAKKIERQRSRTRRKVSPLSRSGEAKVHRLSVKAG